MALVARVLARILIGMFLVGSAGSTVVFVLSAIEDVKMLFGLEDDENHS